jgi:hypothetical protein
MPRGASTITTPSAPGGLQALAFKAIRRLYPDYEIWRDFPYEYEFNEWVDDSAARDRRHQRRPLDLARMGRRYPRGLLDNADWSTYYLTDMGLPIPERVAACPTTYAAIDGHAPLCRIEGRAPSIMFSLLRPHSRIPRHTGMVNCRFICHLPLIVPPHCGFRVAAETREWRVGELLVFDDSVEHEAWNDSDEDRLVLIFDVWRPDVSEEERLQIETLFRVVNSY